MKSVALVLSREMWQHEHGSTVPGVSWRPCIHGC